MSYPRTFEFLEARADAAYCSINIGGTGLAVIWIMVSLSVTVVGARVYSQARIIKQLGISDYLMLCSIAILVAFASLISAQFHYGWGRHQSCIQNVHELETLIKLNLTSQSFGIMGSTFGRMSFIVFLNALFGTKKWVRWTLWGMFVAQVVTNLATVATIYAQCPDPRALYDFSVSDEGCWPRLDQTYLGWAHTAFNGACDLILSLLPALLVWNLQMAPRLKIGLAILLGMSALALVGLIMKCVYLGALSNSGDISYGTVPMFTWIVVEGTLVAIAASLPLLRPLFMRGFMSVHTKAGGADLYDMPRNTGRSGRTASSGFSKLGSSVGGGASTVPRYPGMTALDCATSEEDITLVLQHQVPPQEAGQGQGQLRQQQQQERQQQLQQQTYQQQQHSSHEEEKQWGVGWAEPGRSDRRIMVKQEYMVTSEALAEGWGTRESDVEMGAARTEEDSHLGRSKSRRSVVRDKELPQPPPPAWPRERQ